jgi:hypothetical protein
VLNTLEETALFDKTIILRLADHGEGARDPSAVVPLCSQKAGRALQLPFAIPVGIGSIGSGLAPDTAAAVISPGDRQGRIILHQPYNFIDFCLNFAFFSGRFAGGRCSMLRTKTAVVALVPLLPGPGMGADGDLKGEPS